MRWAGYVARIGGEEIVQGFGGKNLRKETARKTKAYMGGWNQKGP
jgi:hypothetical protein